MAAILDDAQVATVAALADRFGVSVRAPQRALAERIGVPPKWVIRRYRLHEVTERLARGREPSWSALTFELGYADQAHLIRNFRAHLRRASGVLPAAVRNRRTRPVRTAGASRQVVQSMAAGSCRGQCGWLGSMT
ncbi:helix-turn-helix domain-containing protein [Nocardia wallacei]|uniref:helix-turn-helix domain-containing protein n=1 Tax=Nocardia wallacei TaxID=480035 RepID=UPI003CC7EC49